MIRTASGGPAVFVVLTQTGTILSQILRVVTGDAYNHASISVDDSLQTLYSFGRRHPYNPVWGGFVQESPASGTFGRFSGTRAKVLRVPVTQRQYEQIKDHLEQMYQDRRRYHYNYLGLLLAFFHLAYQEGGLLLLLGICQGRAGPLRRHRGGRLRENRQAHGTDGTFGQPGDLHRRSGRVCSLRLPPVNKLHHAGPWRAGFFGAQTGQHISKKALRHAAIERNENRGSSGGCPKEEGIVENTSLS